MGVAEAVTPLRLALPTRSPWHHSSPLPRHAAWQGGGTSTLAGAEGSAATLGSEDATENQEDEEGGTEKWSRMEKEKQEFLHELDTDAVVRRPSKAAVAVAPVPTLPPRPAAADDDDGDDAPVASSPSEASAADAPSAGQAAGGLPLVLMEAEPAAQPDTTAATAAAAVLQQRSPRSRALTLRLSPRSPRSPRRLLSSSPSTTSSPGSSSEPSATSPVQPAAKTAARAGEEGGGGEEVEEGRGGRARALSGQVLGDIARDAMRASYTEAMAERGEQLASPPRASISTAQEPEPEPEPRPRDVSEPEAVAPAGGDGDDDDDAVDVDEVCTPHTPTMRFLLTGKNRSRIGLNSLRKWIYFDRLMGNAWYLTCAHSLHSLTSLARMRVA
jgi:hypothetical protein